MDKTIINKADLINYVLGTDVLVPRAWRTRSDADAEPVTVNGVVSYAGCALSAVLPWATSDRVIARQRVERTMATVPVTVTVPAAEAGRKIRTPEELVADAAKATAGMTNDEFDAYIKKLEDARG